MTDEGMQSSESQEHYTDAEDAEFEDFEEEPAPSHRGLVMGLILLGLIAIFGVSYGWMQHRSVERLASSRDQLNASLAQMRSQSDALTAKVNALSAAQVQSEAELAEAARKAHAASVATAAEHSAHRATARRQPDDPRWKQLEQKLGDQQKQLAESRQQIADTQASLQQARSDLETSLQSARTELGGGIARNHDELVALEKKGERNYYEFDIPKSKLYHHTGPISISLRKANVKHEYCDLGMVVNDAEMSRKHVNLYEPVMFYPEGYPLPLELVVNHIGKDTIHGYVSEPKYRLPQQASAAEPKPQTIAVQSPVPPASNPQLGRRQDDTH